MAYNNYLSIVTAGLAANIPAAPTSVADLAEYPRFYVATDTLALYAYDPSNAAWWLVIQLAPVTVANLPTTHLKKGSLAMVSDLTFTAGTTAVGATAAGSGTGQALVSWSTGTTWKIA